MSDATPGGIAATLTLADWRRSISSLYADVRRLAETDPAAALDHWRAVREGLYRDHPQSPLPADRRATFRAQHFGHDPSLRFELAVEALEQPQRDGAADPDPVRVSRLDFGSGASLAIDLPVSAGGAMAFRRFGAVTIPFRAGPRRLELYWMEGYAGGLFLPFRDATNGAETYGAGRYLLDTAKSADLGGDRAAGTLILDFNFSFQPSCAFDPQWACPLAPPANRLDLPVRAGERLA
ncbi:MAG TPA: DUF1684 domain-containing protein [Candidatus Limnocylindrales bacterium]|nr:DUF1684 domain-containing protein [Candidatus Limnocylindrales bacterium]